MAKNNFDACLVELLKHEGGYSDHPADPGGRTNLGVTQRAYEDWVAHPVSERIMRNLTIPSVRALYKARYWDVVRGNDLPLGLDLCVFDFGVNAGPGRAARYLQRLVGVAEDGQIGPKTLIAASVYVKTHGLREAIMRYQNARDGYYQKLKTFPTFGRGWLRRVAEVTTEALTMAKQA